MQREDDDALFAGNLYRPADQGRFSDAELAGFAGLAGLLLAAVQRHVALLPLLPLLPTLGTAGDGPPAGWACTSTASCSRPCCRRIECVLRRQWPEPAPIDTPQART